MGLKKRGLTANTILLRCRHMNGSCDTLCDALVELDCVSEGFLTKASVEGEKFCVGATFMATEDGIEQMAKEVYRLRDKKRRPIPLESYAIIRKAL